VGRARERQRLPSGPAVAHADWVGRGWVRLMGPTPEERKDF
jgi:hypothetical protein